MSSVCTPGLRPLLAGESDQTSKLSREHACVSPVPGLVIVAGGKYTTYRVMAEDAINEAVKGLPGQDREVHHRRDSADRRRRVQAAVGDQGEPGHPDRDLDLPRIEHLLGRYGSSIHELLALIEAEPELLQPLSTAPKYLKVEAKYAVTHEGALHLDDILARRTRISIDTWDRGDAAAQEVAELVAPILGWDARGRRSGGGALPLPGGRRTGVAADARRPNRRRRTARRGRCPGGGGLSRKSSFRHTWVTLM